MEFFGCLGIIAFVLAVWGSGNLDHHGSVELAGCVPVWRA